MEHFWVLLLENKFLDSKEVTHDKLAVSDAPELRQHIVGFAVSHEIGTIKRISRLHDRFVLIEGYDLELGAEEFFDVAGLPLEVVDMLELWLVDVVRCKLSDVVGQLSQELMHVLVFVLHIFVGMN